jgi:hypothetical protein
LILLSTDDTPTQQLLNEEIPRQFLDQASREGVTEVGDWQSFDVSDKPQGRTIELRNAIFEYHIPKTKRELEFDIRPNMPFAEAQFQDRVSGQPLNPPPSFDLWPWNKAGQEHQDEAKKFSHTYPERFWPTRAHPRSRLGGPIEYIHPMEGIRYPYGDLNDLVTQLARSPSTRQAYLPVFFPEDTGAVSGQRVPCTLGYHFLIRDERLHTTYFIRSCDFLRHFRDDVYLASRLCQWVCGRLHDGDLDPPERIGDNYWSDLVPATLTMHIVSFHVFEGDLPMMRRRLG